MTYLVISVVILLVVGGGITFMVLRATRGASPAKREPGDPTPLGDTPQHAGEQDAEGTTPGPQDAEEVGGTGGPTSGQAAPQGHGPARETEEAPAGRFKRDPVGGEAEAEPAIDVGRPPRADR